MLGDSEAISLESGLNDSLDILIDLVGSDDVIEDPRFCKQPRDGLRDTDGKLHLGKIYSFFSTGQSADLAAAGQYVSDKLNDRIDQYEVKSVRSQLHGHKLRSYR